AYRNPGMLPPLAAGALGGLLSVLGIFIPPFFWVFLFGPFIERFFDNKGINTTFSAVTGGVLRVVLSFSIRFGTGTIFTKAEPISGFGLGLDFSVPNFASADPWALAIAIVAGIAMFRFGLGMVATLVASCAIGTIPYLIDAIGLGSLSSGLLGFVAG